MRILFYFLMGLHLTSALLWEPLCNSPANNYRGNCSTVILQQVEHIFNGSYVDACNCLALRNFCAQECKNTTCFNACITSYPVANQICGCSNPSTVDIYVANYFVGCRIDNTSCPLNATVNLTSIHVTTCYLLDTICQDRVGNTTRSEYSCLTGYGSVDLKHYHRPIDLYFILSCVFVGLTGCLLAIIIYLLWCRRRRQLVRGDEVAFLLE